MPFTPDRDFLIEQEIRRTQPFPLGQPLVTNQWDHRRLHTQHDLWMEVPDPLLRRHMAFMGASGSGKSKLIESFCRHLIDSGNGFTFIDPHGDTAQAMADYAAALALKHGDDYILPRFHYLKPSRDWLFSLDPFDTAAGELPQTVDAEFAAGLEIDNQAQEMTDVLMRRFAQQDKEVMRRLSHWLENALTAISTPNASGARLAFSDILAVLDSSDPDQGAILDAVSARLPRKVQQRYHFFQAIRSPLEREKYIESTINNIRAFLKQMPELIFGRQAPSIDFAKIVRNREIVIVNLRATRQGINERAAMAIADFVIHKIKHACRENDEAEQRVPHHLIVDEASIYLAEDLGHFLDQARKWQLSVCLSSQRLGQFDRGEVELSSTVMAESGMFVSFRQKDLDEVRNLGKFFAYPNYNLEELRTRTQVPDADYDRFVQTTDTSRGTQRVHSEGISAAQTSGVSSTDGISHADQTSTSYARNRNDGRSSSVNQHYTPIDVGGTQVMLPVTGTGQAAYQGSGVSDGDSRSQSTTSIAANSTMRASTVGNFSSESLGTSESVTLKNTLVAGTREEWDPTGQPRLAIPYQDAMHERLLTCLPDRVAFLRTKIENVEQSVLFHTAEVAPAFDSTATAQTEREAFLQRLYAARDYMFRPTSVEAATEARRDAFLGRNRDPSDSPPSQPMHQELPQQPPHGEQSPDSTPDGF